MQGIIYTNDLHFHGYDTLEIDVTDNGYSGVGGFTRDSMSKIIQIIEVKNHENVSDRSKPFKIFQIS